MILNLCVLWNYYLAYSLIRQNDDLEQKKILSTEYGTFELYTFSTEYRRCRNSSTLDLTILNSPVM